MKVAQKVPEKFIWYQVRSPSVGAMGSNQPGRSILPRLLLFLIFTVSLTYILYTVKLVTSPHPCDHPTTTTDVDDNPFIHHLSHTSNTTTTSSASADDVDDDTNDRIGNRRSGVVIVEDDEKEVLPVPELTNLSHIVFGIGASSKLWDKRKNYIKIWYDKSDMRGIVWVENKVKIKKGENLPEIRISGNTDKFPYTNKQGHRSAIRISRIVSETVRLGLTDVRWLVMGDDDTVFVTENLIRVLRNYDHTQYWYIGSNSESHLQNIYFSYAMAYGGGGFAISYPLALALHNMQDRCIHRYPALYGSDDRMQACMAELGVPLTKELGFHQYDVYGNLFGLLAAHPVTPLVSLHHLDVVEPIFPNVTQVEALQRLTVPMKLDSAGLMQQSVCYDKKMKWTISVSWGFAVQIVRGILSPREMEMPTRTFLNWYKRADYTAYAFNTRPVARNPCQKPFVYYLSEARFDEETNQTVSEYLQHHVPHPLCRWKMTEPSIIDRIVVYKKPDPELWNRSPRRNCCRILSTRTKGTMELEVDVCREGEVIEI